jgi:hypothetical protein
MAMGGLSQMGESVTLEAFNGMKELCVLYHSGSEIREGMSTVVTEATFDCHNINSLVLCQQFYGGQGDVKERMVVLQ